MFFSSISKNTFDSLYPPSLHLPPHPHRTPYLLQMLQQLASVLFSLEGHRHSTWSTPPGLEALHLEWSFGKNGWGVPTMPNPTYLILACGTTRTAKPSSYLEIYIQNLYWWLKVKSYLSCGTYWPVENDGRQRKKCLALWIVIHFPIKHGMQGRWSKLPGQHKRWSILFSQVSKVFWLFSFDRRKRDGRINPGV